LRPEFLLFYLGFSVQLCLFFIIPVIYLLRQRVGHSHGYARGLIGSVYCHFQSESDAVHSTNFKRSLPKGGHPKERYGTTLRYSFATHLLENGTDLRYFQLLSGHKISKTIVVYNYLTAKGFGQIKSPLDTLEL
jgi:integrase